MPGLSVGNPYASSLKPAATWGNTALPKTQLGSPLTNTLAAGKYGTTDWFAAENALQAKAMEGKSALALQNNAALIAQGQAKEKMGYMQEMLRSLGLGGNVGQGFNSLVGAAAGGGGAGAGGGVGGGAAGGGGTYTLPGGGGTAAPARETLDPTDFSESDAATWARGKDAVTRSTDAARKTLLESQAARGFGESSGVYSAEEANLLNAGLGALGDLSRQQAITTTDRDAAARLAKYQGGITQRAQDIGLTEAGMGGAVTMRGQDLAAASGRYSLIPSLLSLIGNLAY